MPMKEDKRTWVWKLYEEGRNYNQSLSPNQYNVVETNTEFFIGNQWINLPNTAAMRGLPKPMFNILKRVASLFIASLTSSGITLRYDPLAYYDGRNMEDPDHDAAEMTNAAVANLLEKMKFEYRVRDALTDGAQVGDYCAHFWFDPDDKPYGGAFGQHKGEINMELLEGINVMFGNPNDRRVQTQPYILLVGRDTVKNLQHEAERFRKSNGGSKAEAESIQPDNEYDLMPGVGGKVELTADDDAGKALYVICYTKDTREVTAKDENGEPIMDDVFAEDGSPEYE